MNLKEFFELAVQAGMDADPRGRDVLEQELREANKSFDELETGDREYYDTDRLRNPYTDSRILHGNPEQEVSKVLAGIDIEAPEIILADRLNQKGAGIDLVLSHHPEGRAYANFYEVMRMQADILNRFGVPINVAEGLLEGRMKEVERKLLPVNHSRGVDAARLLDIPLVCLHTPADNMVASHLQTLFDRERPRRLKDVLALIRTIPEYQHARRNNTGPKLLLGAEGRSAGRIFVDMTGGTEGAKEAIEKISQAGVGTLVVMHMSEDHRKESERHHLNVIVAGHIASDNLGLNLLLDAVEKHRPFDVLECSGFRRVRRNQDS